MTTELLGCSVDDSGCNVINNTEENYSSDWFSDNIPIWNNYKELFSNKENIHYLEIGSFEGRSAIYAAQNYCNGYGSHVDAVDTWKGSVEHDEILKNGLYERFVSNAKQYIDSQKIILHRGLSSEIMILLISEINKGTRDKYDVIYVDGSHIGKDVLLDSVLAWQALKLGGVLLFDDYQWTHFNESADTMTPKPAIDAFLSLNKGLYELLHQDYQVHIKKIAEEHLDY